jgi:hypothetical protein
MTDSFWDLAYSMFQISIPHLWLQNDEVVFRIRRIRMLLGKWIRIRIRNLFVRIRIRILTSTSKKIKKNLDFYCFLYDNCLGTNLEALFVPYLCFHMELLGVIGRQMSSNRWARIGVHRVTFISRAGRESPIN